MELSFTARTFWASFISSLKMIVRYVTLRGLVAFNISVPLFFVLTSWVIGEFMTGGEGVSVFFTETTGMADYLSFVTIGFAFNSFIFSAVFGGGHAIRGEQEHGTAELVFVTPSNKLAWLLGKMMGNLIFSFVTFFTLLVFGAVLFGFHPKAPPNIPLAIVGILLTMIALTAFGFVFAGICFTAKRENELGQVLWPMMVLFSGLAFPITNFPLWWKTIAWMIPVTHGVEITRNALLLGSSFLDHDILIGLGILVLQTIILLPIGTMLYTKMEKAAKKKGTLATY
ncbi:MAG: ABC transporter permease [Candidatus Bathyarchaeota archaeon]|nr:MAG: ABC transporter permease [Candidatus Bathyarchaeota archaeon]